VILPSEPRAQDDTAHLMFDVADAAATPAAANAAGGKIDGEPQPSGNTGIIVGFAVGFAIDPAGSRIELIQRPRR
jgi:predicted enzyme related to lactoylglutathione lyase